MLSRHDHSPYCLLLQILQWWSIIDYYYNKDNVDSFYHVYVLCRWSMLLLLSFVSLLFVVAICIMMIQHRSIINIIIKWLIAFVVLFLLLYSFLSLLLLSLILVLVLLLMLTNGFFFLLLLLLFMIVVVVE